MKKSAKLTLKIDKTAQLLHKCPTEPVLSSSPGKTLAQIDEQLFLGSYEDASNYFKLKEHNIEAIINCSPVTCPNLFQGKEGFQYFNFDLCDSPNFELWDPLVTIVSLIKKLKQKGLNILIHCYQGVSRAPSVAIGYLIACEKKNFDEAMRLVKRNYGKADPNIGFILQLEQVYLDMNGILKERGCV